MKILAIDTSGLVASVAVTDGDILVSEFSIQFKTTHSQILVPMMDAIKKNIGMDLEQIDAVAVAKGPGSFTGLRIGAATAKGLCLALNKPLIPVPTVDGMAYNLYGAEKIICPMMDARRNQVYTGLYTFIPTTHEGTGQITYTMKTIESQMACSIDELTEKINKLGKTVIFLGDGVPVYHDKLEELIQVPFSVALLNHNRQSAASVAALAQKIYEDGGAINGMDFAPDYLRMSQAEREGGSPKGSKKTTKRPGIVRIREMRAEDITEAYELEKESLGHEAWTEKQILEASTRDDTIYVVAEKTGKIVGLCGVRNVSGDGEITNVSVSKAHRNDGIGYKMLKQLIERGKGLGINAYTLEVRASNAPAIRLYEKLGFKCEGIRPSFYTEPADDAAIYWRKEQ
ncbi:MAG: tRNA (adenosine(37)-N6)-threonylcarbamoyltransferase complex dimerization subunit type 1 TsaB [Butyrivibrio sp.]|nr:tRNA (adenosine(37)-N6)-threonylcarbamoyltransferase complex dimerization subunit type 1 TsaB [Butyrivibrio sp.]